MRIRRAESADLEAVIHQMQRMQDDDPWSEVFDLTTVRANVAELLENPAYGLIYLAFEASQPVAYLVLCFDYSMEYRGKGAWVDELFVQRAHRGKGIATQLLEAVEKAATEHNAKYLHLEVSDGNPAIELYRRRGFVDHQRYLMTKRLGE
jgi:GNAT superfamily N-acetyltransferase